MNVYKDWKDPKKKKPFRGEDVLIILKDGLGYGPKNNLVIGYYSYEKDKWFHEGFPINCKIAAWASLPYIPDYEELEKVKNGRIYVK